MHRVTSILGKGIVSLNLLLLAACGAERGLQFGDDWYGRTSAARFSQYVQTRSDRGVVRGVQITLEQYTQATAGKADIAKFESKFQDKTPSTPKKINETIRILDDSGVFYIYQQVEPAGQAPMYFHVGNLSPAGMGFIRTNSDVIRPETSENMNEPRWRGAITPPAWATAQMEVEYLYTIQPNRPFGLIKLIPPTQATGTPGAEAALKVPRSESVDLLRFLNFVHEVIRS